MDKTIRKDLKFVGIATALVAAFGLLSGCASTEPVRYVINVDALAAREGVNAKSYVLIPSNDRISVADLRFQEYATYLDRALDMSGFVKADSVSQADIAVLVGYGISDGETQAYSQNVPRFGQTGIASSTTYGTVHSYGGGYGTYSGTTTYQPTYGVTGYSTYVGTYTTYTRVLELVAVDQKRYESTKEIHELWRVSAISSGSSGDLRKVFPVLVAAAQPYLGKSTDKKAVEVVLPEEDPRIIVIRDGVDVLKTSGK